MHVGLVSAAPGATRVDKFAWVADAFHRVGCRVTRLFHWQDVARFDSIGDLVLFDQYNAGVNDADLVQFSPHRRTTWFQWWRDLLLVDPTLPISHQGAVAACGAFMRSMDLVLVKSRESAAALRQSGYRVERIDQACPCQIESVEHAERPEFDVLVLGVPRPQRIADASTLIAAGFKVAWAGDGGGALPNVTAFEWLHPMAQLPALVSRASCVLSVDARTDLDGYWSDRVYLTAGMGACVLHRGPSVPPVPHVAYANGAQLVAAAELYTRSLKARKSMGKAARTAVLARHTYEHRAKTLLGLFEKHRRAVA